MGFFRINFLYAGALNDATTDCSKPPALYEVRNGKPSSAPLPYPSEFKGIQARKHPELAALVSRKPPDELFALALSLAEKRFEVLTADSAARRLQAVARTRLLRFRDDVAVEVRDKGAYREVQMRSRSRVGKSDFGANAKRITAFLGALARLSGMEPARDQE